MGYMSTALTYKTVLKDSDATEQLGNQLGRNLSGGEVIELASDLGGGKTTLTRGIVAGAGSSDVVSSPTFMVHKPYKTPGFTIDHFDFYRLNDPGMVAAALAENVADPKSVIIVEWADSVGHVLPNERLKIRLVGMPTHENEREVMIEYPQKFAYLLEGVEE